jgi:plasmid maintenance system antidote protein VapI
MRKSLTQKGVTTSIESEEFEKYISQAEAARIMGITKQTVAKLIGRARFTTQAVAGRLFLIRSQVESYVAKPTGRPSKKSLAEKAAPKKRPKNVVSSNLGEYISQAEAARIRGVTQQAIDNLVKKNRFQTMRIGGRTLLSRSDVEAFQPKMPGRAPKSTRKR